MSMVPFNGDITQSLKWLQNNAPNIQSLVTEKAAWYSKYNATFWSDWQANVFDLRTAQPFGLMVWCIILGVPSQLFGLYPQSNSFAYGQDRQNYKWDKTSPVTNPNMLGGNFAAGGNTTLLNLNDVRHALQLRYAALVSNGRLSFINNMLRYIFNGGEPWDFGAGVYFYVVDSTFVPAPVGITGLYQNDWQGFRALSATPRTNQMTNFPHIPFGAITVTLNSAVAPDGTNTAATYTTTAAAGETYTLIHVPGSSTNTYSVFARYVSGSPLMSFGNDATTPNTRDTAVFNLQTGVVTRQPTDTNAVASMLPAGNGYYRCIVTYPEPSSSPINDSFIIAFNAAAAVANLAFPQWESGGVVGSYIPTTSTVTASATDYSFDPVVGAVTFTVAPPTGAVLTWSGSVNNVPVNNEQFGVGNGIKTVFSLGSTSPVTQDHYMEYRIGPNLPISAQFLTLMNSPQYGIVPNVAGTRYLVIQE